MEITYREAIQSAFFDEMQANDNVVLFGEDIQNNVYGYSYGLVEQFGENRIINIPISEAAVLGVACGAAMCGMRPIVDLTLPNFMCVAMDQIVNMMAKIHYMSDGRYQVPVTIFVSSMQGGGNAAQHSDRFHALFMGIPGIKVITPATAQDMYSMMRGAIQDNNPVICFADRSLFWRTGEIDCTKIIFPGTAKLIKEGDNLTVITISSCLQMVMDDLEQIEQEGCNIEIIDIRSVKPIDYALLEKSAKKTGRVLICDTANKAGSVASEIAAELQLRIFPFLKAPIQIAASQDIPVPFARHMEQEVLITADKIIKSIKGFEKGEK